MHESEVHARRCASHVLHDLRSSLPGLRSRATCVCVRFFFVCVCVSVCVCECV